MSYNHHIISKVRSKHHDKLVNELIHGVTEERKSEIISMFKILGSDVKATFRTAYLKRMKMLEKENENAD